MDNNLTQILSTSLPVKHDTVIDDLLLFQISAGILTIICIVSNSALFASSIYSRKPRSGYRGKTILFLSQSIAGLISPFSFLYPAQLCKLQNIYPLSNSTLQFLTSYSSCFTTSIIPLIIAILAPISHNLLLTLDIYLPLIDCQMTWRQCVFLNGFVWFIILLFAFLPLFGWNNWNEFCYVPSVLSVNYTGIISMMYILQFMACTYMLIGTFITSRAGKESLTEEVVSKRMLLIKIPTWAAKTRFAVLLILLLCDLPLILHILVHLSGIIYQPIILINITYSDVVLPWLVFLSLLSNAFIPPLTIATDPLLSTAIITIIHQIWCCKPKYIRTNRHPPARRLNAVGPATVEFWERN